MVVSVGSNAARAPYFVLTPDRRARALNVVGTQVTVLAANAATKSYGITLQQGDEGTGPPPHSHDWDEAFYVLRGEIHFVCDGEAHVCQPGTLVHIPRGTVHAFQYGKGGAKCWRSLDRMPAPPRCLPPSIRQIHPGRRTSRNCCRCSSRMGSPFPVLLEPRRRPRVEHAGDAISHLGMAHLDSPLFASRQSGLPCVC